MNFRSGFALLITSILLISCDEDDDSNNAPTNQNPAYAAVFGPTGHSFQIIGGGQTQTNSGTTVIGWDGGQLLNGSYFRLLRFSGTPYNFALRMSMPASSNFSDTAPGDHDLYEFILPLQETQNLQDIVVEFYQNNVTPAIQGNGTGTVTLERNVAFAGTTYSLIGTVEAQFFNAGTPTTVSGTFWSQELNW